MSKIEDLFESLGGVASVPDMAQYFDITEREVRDWAGENCLPRVGNNYAFTIEHAEALAADLEPEPDEDGPDDEGDEEEDDDDDQGEDDE